jgi:hypothetical protein
MLVEIKKKKRAANSSLTGSGKEMKESDASCSLPLKGLPGETPDLSHNMGLCSVIPKPPIISNATMTAACNNLF